MIHKIIIFVIFSLCVFSGNTQAQNYNHIMIIDYKDTLSQTKLYSIEEAYNHNKKMIQDWHQTGYLLASIDSVLQNDSTMITYAHTGIRYQWDEIRISHLPEDLQQVISSKWGKTVSRIAHPEELKSLYNIIYSYAEENQYPFAVIYFDSIEINKEKITAKLQYESGLATVIDTVKLHYDAFLSEGFVKNYFGLYHKMPYDIKTLNKINSKVNALPFVRLSQPWDINFSANHNTLNLYLKERKANQANALVGIQPTNDEDQKYMITADVLFKLYNSFGYGEMFHLTYQQIQNNSPKFNTSIQWPYIMNTRWGVDANFDFMKYDTLFRKTNAHIGTQYLIDEQNHFSIFYEIESNRTIHFDTAYIRVNKKLPANIDLRKQGIGMTYQIGRLDDILSPTTGFIAQFSGATFSKKIIKNNAIENISDADVFDYNQLFDTIQTSIFQFRLQSDIQYFFTFGQILTFKISNHNGWIGGNNFIYKNELFTLGGLKMLRGFNELSIFTSQYFLGTIEPRIYIGDNSYIFAFTDLSYLTAHYNDNITEKKWMNSLGLGGQLNTQSGLFNLAFALGKDGQSPLPKLRDIRVHIGYSIYF